MNFFDLASKYAAPSIAAVLLAIVSGLFVRGKVLEAQRDTARIERDNARTIITGLQDQAKSDAIELALLREAKAAIDSTADEQGARTAATLARQGQVLSNLEKELRNVRSTPDGISNLGATLTRVLSEQRNGVAAALESRARRIRGDEASPVQTTGELAGGPDNAATDARYDGHDGSGDYRQAIDLRSGDNELGRNRLAGVSKLAGAMAQPSQLSEPIAGEPFWLMEIHAWSRETHDQVPAFHRFGTNAVTANFAASDFTDAEACKLHSYHVIKSEYDTAKETQRDLAFGSTVFCKLVSAMPDESPFKDKWFHVRDRFLKPDGKLV